MILLLFMILLLLLTPCQTAGCQDIAVRWICARTDRCGSNVAYAKVCRRSCGLCRRPVSSASAKPAAASARKPAAAKPSATQIYSASKPELARGRPVNSRYVNATASRVVAQLGQWKQTSLRYFNLVRGEPAPAHEPLEGAWFVGRGQAGPGTAARPAYESFAFRVGSDEQPPPQSDLRLLVDDYSMGHNLFVRRVGPGEFIAVGGQDIGHFVKHDFVTVSTGCALFARLRTLCRGAYGDTLVTAVTIFCSEGTILAA